MIRDQKGAAMVEFAILAPVMIFLAIGMIDIGRYAYYSIVAANAARAGAQFGSQNLEQVENTTGIVAAGNADSGGVSLNFTPPPVCMASVNNGVLTSCPAGGTSPASGTVYYVQVTATNQFHPLIPYPGIPSNVTVTGSSTMRVANQ